MLKWLMSSVLPGFDEVFAKPLRWVSMLMRLDLPTFERPMKAYSGNFVSGHLRQSVLLMTYSAFLMSINILLKCNFAGAKIRQIFRIPKFFPLFLRFVWQVQKFFLSLPAFFI